METDPDRWIAAVRHSHDALRALAGPLTPDQLQQRSYDSEWSIAQVLSHLGSQAEVFNLWLDAGLTGQDPPGRDAFPPIWEAWDTRSPQAQAADSLQVNEVLVERLESLDDGERERFRLQMFGMDLDIAGLARMRLAEHAIHSWDVAVALDPSARVAPEAVGLLIDTLGQLAARAGQPDGNKRRVHVSADDPERHFTLETGQTVTLEPVAAEERDEDGAELRLPAEALVRLVYGRLDPARTPPVKARGIDLDELRPLFPGF
ncbi:MAG TPA: maleylpyruvate isomerase family mycothiol-dependent enzyme [Streptosporangiaceae bacterium]|nr:maleylpyruvate isomerase family mycothiol-dependent enzyme [Streptosporangiaceae bacterium]